MDPSELELRDLLGIAPETAMSWDSAQRASAREVLDHGMRDSHAASVHAALGREPLLDRSITTALAAGDDDRARHHTAALGVVDLELGTELHATAHRASLAPHATASIDVQLVGWERWSTLPPRGLDVLATLAADAGHPGGPLVVAPAAQLAVVAAYVPASTTSTARLVVNPVLLAALEPASIDGASAERGDASAAHGAIADRVATLRGDRTAAPSSPAMLGAGGRSALAADGTAVDRDTHDSTRPLAATAIALTAPANPYSFYDSVGACATAQRQRCESCLPSATCKPVAGSDDGNAECAQLAANSGRGYSLLCINLALSIDSVARCTSSRAPSCSFDPTAGGSIAALDRNASFLDMPLCGQPLDTCLASIFGDAPESTPSQPDDMSPGCADSACDASTCDAEGANCDDGGSCDGGTDDTGGDCGGGDSSESSCDGGDSGGDCSGDSGGDCGGDSGGDCSGGGGDDCSGGGGDCSGGGGDCSGGGGDCNAGHRKRGGESTTTTYAFLWACLPLPFALIVSRRAARRRARREAAQS